MEGLLCVYRHWTYNKCNVTTITFYQCGVFLLTGLTIPLHIGNVEPSISGAHSVSIDQTFNNLANILIKIKYKKYSW